MYPRLSGRIPAVVTPLKSDHTLDDIAFEKLIEKIMASHAQGVMVLGSCGEGPLFSTETIKEVVACATKAVGPNGIVVAGSTALTRREVLINCEAAKEAGAYATLNIAPFYFSPTPYDYYQHFFWLAEHSPLPIMIYNMPSVTQTAVPFDVVKELSRHPNVVGMKDSSGNFTYFQKLAACFRDDPQFSLFMGKGTLIAPALCCGAAGTMTPLSNLYPEMEETVYQAIQHGDLKQAFEVQDKIVKVLEILNAGRDSLGSVMKGILSLGQKDPLCSPPEVFRLSNEELSEKSNRITEIIGGETL